MNQASSEEEEKEKKKDRGQEADGKKDKQNEYLSEELKQGQPRHSSGYQRYERNG